MERTMPVLTTSKPVEMLQKPLGVDQIEQIDQMRRRVLLR